ncbi:hypothetical protein DEJ23_03730 [Curtobacterium sp. MCSS17_008]|uniref:hypothetical protein n=1 Tax=Curtobacterium sp. MCSS17_008 TaxID=2175647 RepID=UPI000DA938E3|nr:hypothetical protein [Curtobacterium sp. MCSS17_008]PZF58898.1 hypothetical protein DEJ23_03730 [Curtobacterium sp. MCSS17_008]
MGEATMPAAGRLRTPVFDVLLRPRRSLVRSTVLSVVFSAVPLAVALVWVSLPVRWWPLVASLVVVLAVLVGVLFVRLGQAFLGIDSDSVVLNAVLTPNRRIARDRVQRIVVAPTYGASADRTTRELLAFDADGVHLFRMGADVWGDAALDRVLETLDVPVEHERRPVDVREATRRWPGSRTWYERRAGVLAIGAVAVCIVAGLVAVETVGALTR